jgi:GNAT superfamily N-acetyltransferase
MNPEPLTPGLADDRINPAIDAFVRTWLNARNIKEFRLEQYRALTHIAYRHPPMSSDPTRLDEFLALERAPLEIIRDVRALVDTRAHWLTVFTFDPVKTRHEYQLLGYHLESQEFLMALSDLPRHLRPPNPAIQVTRVRSLQECDWVNQAYWSALADPRRLADPTVGYYYVRRDNIPVTSGRFAILDNRIVGPDKIQTHSEYRRQGFAFEMLNAMHRDAATQGCVQAVLLSSVEGRSLYHKLGYHDVIPAVVFTSGRAY